MKPNRLWASLPVAVGLVVLPAAARGGEDPGSERVDLSLSDSLFADTGVSGTADPEHRDHAQMPARSKPRGDWEFTLSPYLWMTSLRASTEIGPITSTSEAYFSDLIQHLDGAAQLRFEGQRDRWGFFLDGTYLTVSDDARVKTQRFRFRGVDTDVQLTEAWLDFGGMYQLGNPGRTFDLMLGGRYAYVSTEVSVGPFEADRSEDWLAPLVGGRFQFDISENWLASLKAEVGGFGVGDAPDLSWGVTALLGYRLNDSATLGLGYRFYDIDFSSGRLEVDMQYHGPLVGMSFRF